MQIGHGHFKGSNTSSADQPLQIHPRSQGSSILGDVPSHQYIVWIPEGGRVLEKKASWLIRTGWSQSIRLHKEEIETLGKPFCISDLITVIPAAWKICLNLAPSW
jgi:hypothetical protein